jgi:sensor histidine kinase regulating citrate/malate metabolism
MNPYNFSVLCFGFCSLLVGLFIWFKRQDQLKRIFEPFYTTKASGTGLGLYITQQLVEKIRGRIHVHSEAGTGTTFSVLLPIYP